MPSPHPQPGETLARFLRAEEGLTALEFCFVAPILILMLFAVIEFSLVMLVSNMMESATNISSRLGKTGFTASGQSREETILASIRERAGPLIDPTLLTIGTKVYGRLSQIGQPEPWHDTNHNGSVDPGEYDDINGNGVYDTDMARAGYGGARDIVVYTVSYPWEIQTPIMRELIGDANGRFPITASAVVKNEPYDTH